MVTKTVVITLITFLLAVVRNCDGQYEDYCIADEQAPEDELVEAMNWACRNGADCTAIQHNGPCFFPDTVKDHASYAFNSYYQNMKTKGGSCYFNSAALISDLNPSHGSCKYHYLSSP